MKFSIILPVYNGASTIVRAIESVIEQSFTGWHLYIINDHSSDNTLQLINTYRKHKNITVINNDKNQGVSYSRNLGISKSQEEIISFIDSDDEWMPEKLQAQLAAIKAGASIVISDYNYISNNKYPVRAGFDSLSRNNFIKKKFRVCLSSLCFLRGEYVPEFEKIGHEDFLFIYQLLSKYEKMTIVPYLLVNYYEMGGSLSSNKFRAALWHLNVLKFIFPGKRLIINYYFFFYIWNAIKFKVKVSK